MKNITIKKNKIPSIKHYQQTNNTNLSRISVKNITYKFISNIYNFQNLKTKFLIIFDLAMVGGIKKYIDLLSLIINLSMTQRHTSFHQLDLLIRIQYFNKFL